MKTLKQIINEAYTGNASTAAWILMTLASKGMGMYTKEEIQRKLKLPDPKIYYFDVKINRREPIEGRIAATSNTGYTHERKAGGPLNPTKVKYFNSEEAIKIALRHTKVPEDFIRDFLSNPFLVSPRAILVTKNGKKEKL